MSSPIISVENLSKAYLVGHRGEEIRQTHRHTDLREVIGRGLRNSVRNAIDFVHGRQIIHGDSVEKFWALRSVNFELHQGEVIGFIGRNGAGKSTLLKILSRITEPSCGRVTLRGRVASLLEVGTGFHPELTGRENIYLNGAILGMDRAEVRKKFEEIVAFAEVERFLDTPVKRYSSGMYVRLAFAVAAHLEPEILVVDEVLAVGDAEFQKKCLGKMNDASRREGRTVLLVSHNMGIVNTLCPRVIWLNEGMVQADGSARPIIDNYLLREAPNHCSVIQLGDIPRPSIVRDERFRFKSVEWLSGLPLRHGDMVKVRVRFEIRRSVSGLAIGIGICNREGIRFLNYNSDFENELRPDLYTHGDYWVDVTINSMPLAPDIYTLDIGCRSGDSHLLDFLPACSELEVISGSRTPGYISRFTRAGAHLACDWAWNFADDLAEPQLMP